ncbi:MAG TPA: tetratricopeptide repeat protein, partial [Ferruginibacter sp.]|nr:tetratricopeptide repeat protein [Ferruginibacter sp.]
MRSILIIFLFLSIGVFAQKQKADSLVILLNNERTDTGKVKLMWNLAGVINVYDPESAVLYAQKALALSTKLGYIEGQSKSLGALANTFIKTGNYTKALELNLRKLKLEEKGNNPLNLAYALMNIGIVYRYQEEYNEALKYYYRSDSVISQNNLEQARYYLYMNLGDVYDRINNNDSAFSYFNKSLIISNNLKDDDFIGNSMTGLGHTYFKQANAPFSLMYYQSALTHLRAANDDDVFCEAALGLATVYRELLHKNDSAVYYASLCMQLAEKDGFITKQLDAANFLSKHFKSERQIDSAYVYLDKVQQLNDSINSKEKIRELQMLSSNESFRQLEIEENKKIARKERKQQLQLLFIGFFIPGFFLVTLLLSRIRIHTRVIKI